MIISGLRADVSASSSKTAEAARRSIERLSAGDRVVRAANDPAGLVSAEQLRFHGGTMAMALRNAQDSMSILRVADSALASIMGLVEQGRDLKLSLGGAPDLEAALASAEEWRGLGETIESVARTEYSGVRLLDGTYKLDIAVATEPPQRIGVEIKSSTGGGFDLQSLGLGTAGTPTSLELLTVDAFDAALGQVLVARARLGATENRLVYASNVLLSAMQNANSAEVSIRSSGLQDDLVELTRSQISMAADRRTGVDLNALHRYSVATLVPNALGGPIAQQDLEWPDDPTAPVLADSRLVSGVDPSRSSQIGLGVPGGMLVDVAL